MRRKNGEVGSPPTAQILKVFLETLATISTARNGEGRCEAIREFRNLLLRVPDDGSAMSDATLMALEDVAHDLDDYDPRGEEGYYNDEVTVLRHVAAGLEAIAREALDQWAGGGEASPRMWWLPEEVRGGASVAGRRLRAVAGMLAMVARSERPVVRRGWIDDLIREVNGLVGGEEEVGEGARRVLREVAEGLAAYDPSALGWWGLRGLVLRVAARLGRRRGRGEALPYADEETVLRHVVRGLLAVGWEALKVEKTSGHG